MPKIKLTIEICGNVAFVPEIELSEKSPHGGSIGALAHLCKSLEEICDHLKATHDIWDDDNVQLSPMNDEQERAANKLRDIIDGKQ